MKTDSWRRLPTAYPSTGELAPRYTDLDRWQHLNNAALIGLHGENLQRWLATTLGPQAWRDAQPELCMQHSQTDFLAEGQYPAPLATGARLMALDEHGLVLASALFQNGQCAGLHQARLQACTQGQAVPLPAAWRAPLQAALAAQPPLPDAPLPDAPLPDAPQPAMAAATRAPAQDPAAQPLPTLDALPFRLSLASRFGDSDAQGMASDLTLARLAEETRVQFLTACFGSTRLGSATGFMVGHVALRRVQRSASPAHWQVGCGVLRLVERSLAVRGALFDASGASPVCCAVCDTVMVVIDRHSHRSTALPAEARALLSRWLIPKIE